MTHSKATTIEATYRIVTPMFCSGADQKSAELRVPSFKGALRFWWRAAEWGRFCSAANGDQQKALNALRNEEDTLFGSCGSGQSRILLSISGTRPDDSELVRDWPHNKPPFGSTYLGFGITESGRLGSHNYKPHRNGLPCGNDIRVVCRIRPGRDPVDSASVIRTLRLLGLVGGLGSRSRRGFGSIAILEIDGEDCTCQSPTEYRQRIRESLLPEALSGPWPPYTAVSSDLLIADVSAGPDAFQTHNELGERYREFRGQPGPHRGASKRPLGLPLKNVDEDRRRASPLLMHVHPVGQGFLGSVLFLPAQFHPEIRDGNSCSFYEIARTWLLEMKGGKL